MRFPAVAVAVGLMLMVVVIDRPAVVEGAITCPQVQKLLRTCVGYLKHGGNVEPSCCNGVKSLNNLAKKTPERRQACRCLKDGAAIIRNINYTNVALLPGKCGVRIPYRISPSLNCNTVT
ncbi:Non-specific lipid-transfer protein [Heracleum sosnowskyi]|uniref:Non-specific lipid-transfer protein n=1 Tax=Heracleum sosnowskyi TaxID=360622 RepID=A0AAD8HF71_9APIA|nr:Non-specific lipid-transfer protein [Heracleum sosnowskyi]